MIRRFLVIALFIPLFLFAQEGGWDAGLGGGGFALAVGANSVYLNPGGITGSPYSQVMFSYARLYSSLSGDAIQDANVFFMKPFKVWGLGIGGSHIFIGSLYQESAFMLAFSRYLVTPWTRRWSLSLGISPRVVSINFPSSGFFEFNRDDPIFRKYGTSKTDFTADIGLKFNYGSLILGVGVDNLKPLNLSLAGEKAGEIPRRVKTGVGLSYRERIDFELSADKGLAQKEPLRLHFGTEAYIFSNLAGFRAGALYFDNNIKSLAFGLTIRPLNRFFFDYALVIPTGDVKTIGGASHRVSFGVNLAQAPKIAFELAIDSANIRSDRAKINPGEIANILVPIVNMGDVPLGGIGLNAYIARDEGSDSLIAHYDLPRIGNGKSFVLNMPVNFEKPGWYRLRFVLDEDGVLKGDNRVNNVGYFHAAVFEPPKAAPPQVPSGKIIVSRVSFEKEEYPLNPLFFFERGKSELNERFDKVLQTIVERLKSNPQIGISIHGYYDPDGEGMSLEGCRRLAIRRAESVKNRLIELGAPREQVSVDTSGYEPSERRSGSGGYYWTIEDSIMCSEENRRVELIPRILSEEIYIGSIFYSPNSTRFEEGKLNDLLGKRKYVMDFLEANSEAVLYFEGVIGKNESERLAYKRASSLRSQFGKDLPSYLAQRMCVFVSKDTSDTGFVRVYLNGDGIIYRPVGEKTPGELLRTSGERIILSDVQAQAGIDSFAVTVLKEDGSRFALITAGKGVPPGEVFWDGRSSTGETLAEGKHYFIQLYLRDKIGQEVTSRSMPLLTEIKEEKKIEEFIIVNFGFGGTVPNTPFLESRIESAARRIIEKAGKGQLVATVCGYTDIIGPEKVNLALSQKRAEHELKNLRVYLMDLLDLDTDEQLDRWLREKQVTLEASGFGEGSSLVVVVGGREILIGDNKTPEGRSINRRVTLQLETK